MTSKELQVLRIVKQHGKTHPRTVARKLGVSASYAGPLMAGLVRRGELEAVGHDLYVVTEKGAMALAPYRGRSMPHDWLAPRGWPASSAQ